MFKQPLALTTNARGNEVDQGVRVPDQRAEDSDRHIGVERDDERGVHAAARELDEHLGRGRAIESDRLAHLVVVVLGERGQGGCWRVRVRRDGPPHLGAAPLPRFAFAHARHGEKGATNVTKGGGSLSCYKDVHT